MATTAIQLDYLFSFIPICYIYDKLYLKLRHWK